MAWILDTYGSMTSSSPLNAAACVTGKPVGQGGVRGRTEATGRGVFYGVRECCAIPEDMKAIGLEPGLEGKSVIIQGLGNVGYHAAYFMQEAGARLVGLAEYEGAIYDAKGLDIKRVVNHRRATGSILDYPGAENISDSSLVLERPCDILVPAALESQIRVDNVDRIQAKIIAEAANGPVTAAADKFLNEKGVRILPDVYLNAGGVTVSYFEWLRNLAHVRHGRMSRRYEEHSARRILYAVQALTGADFKTGKMDSVVDAVAFGASEVDLVNSGLEDTMVEAYHEINHLSKQHGIDLRTAAFINSIEKIAVAYLQLGIFP